MSLELFEVLENRLEQILTQYQTLKTDNASLLKSLQEKEQALKEAQEYLDKIGRERELVKQRIDQLLHKLGSLGAET
ncbi:MAG: cell division protein ZapB [Desulfobacca sp.]|nr:cell division protein ZapB [Desulfobacca sp.]